MPLLVENDYLPKVSGVGVCAECNKPTDELSWCMMCDRPCCIKCPPTCDCYALDDALPIAV